jgi:predicted nucleic acid-binding Zn ribbon protein
MLSAPAFKLNGSGWYETDFKKPMTKTEAKTTATEASVKTDNQKNV